MDSKNSKDLSEIVKKAKKKDSEALSELYSCTHNLAYFTAVSILKNEQDALDVVQDSYIAVFGKLDELQDNTAFLAWLKRIVANNCKNMLKRKNPQLFGSDEEETDTLENIEEQGEDFLPQTYIEQQSKREQIMQIINQLSDAQKATILLFYYDQLSVHEIAQTMECTESTVTSRISYAKKHIKSEVEKLEKKGDKLYAMAPVPFLTKLFSEEAKNHIMSETAAKTVFSNAVSATTTAATVSTTASVGNAAGIFAKFAALSVAGKCIAVGVAAAIIATSGFAVAAIKHSQDNQAVPTVAAVSAATSSLPSVNNFVSLQETSSRNNRYIIKEYQGHIGIFENGAASPLKQINVDLTNLPEADRELLSKGIYASDMGMVNQILANCGFTDSEISTPATSKSSSGKTSKPSSNSTANKQSGPNSNSSASAKQTEIPSQNIIRAVIYRSGNSYNYYGGIDYFFHHGTDNNQVSFKTGIDNIPIGTAFFGEDDEYSNVPVTVTSSDPNILTLSLGGSINTTDTNKSITVYTTTPEANDEFHSYIHTPLAEDYGNSLPSRNYYRVHFVHPGTATITITVQSKTTGQTFTCIQTWTIMEKSQLDYGELIAG